MHFRFRLRHICMLKKIQAKPEHVKEKISLLLTLLIFGGIVFVWWSSWSARRTSVENRERTASPTESVREVFADVVTRITSKISSAPFYGGEAEQPEMNITNIPTGTIPPQSASLLPAFDVSGIVIIDLATSTKRGSH